MKNADEYDRFAKQWHQKMTSGTNYGHHLVEKPAMESLMPTMNDGKVLALGCGTGEEFALLKQYGAIEIVGVDASQQMLDICQHTHPDVTVICADLDHESLPNGGYDLVYSSLFIHYITDLSRLAREIDRVLRPGGTLLVSTHHPAWWNGERSPHHFALGAYEDNDGNLRPVGDYLTERQEESILMGELRVMTWRRSIEAIVQPFMDAGLMLAALREPAAIDFATDDVYTQWRIETYQKIPCFVCLKFNKPL